MNDNEIKVTMDEAERRYPLTNDPEHNELVDQNIFVDGAEYGYNLAKSSEPRWIKASERVPDTTYPVYVRFDGFKDVAYFEGDKWLYAANDEPMYPAFTRNIEWLYEPETT